MLSRSRRRSVWFWFSRWVLCRARWRWYKRKKKNVVNREPIFAKPCPRNFLGSFKTVSTLIINAVYLRPLSTVSVGCPCQAPLRPNITSPLRTLDMGSIVGYLSHCARYYSDSFCIFSIFFQNYSYIVSQILFLIKKKKGQNECIFDTINYIILVYESFRLIYERSRNTRQTIII